MYYQVLKNGTELIADSGLISAVGPSAETYEGKSVDSYQTSWSYQLPAVGTGIVPYTIIAHINCGWRIGQANQNNWAVLGEQTVYQSFLHRIISAINSLFGKGGVLGITSAPKSLKLGTFTPSAIMGSGCEYINLQINYD